MFRAALRQYLEEAAKRAVTDGALPDVPLPSVEVDVPRGRRHADYATNLPLALARTAGRPPREIAQAIVDALEIPPQQVARVEIAGAGFINFFLAPAWLHDLLRHIYSAGDTYGNRDLGRRRRVNVEYVSANPTGPLHIGSGRNGVIGDVLANLLAALGYDVVREYYINDAGLLVHALAQSVEHHYFAHFGQEKPFPEDGYRGEYVRDLAMQIVQRDGNAWLARPEEERLTAFREFALGEILAEMRRTLEEFGIRFDVWFSERALYEQGAVDRALTALRERGLLYEQDGAVWFRSTSFGDDKDRVIIRSNGRPMYYAADIPYHLNKLERGFELLIDVWGVDHFGDVARVKGGLAALGVDTSRLEILLYQHVRLRNEGELLRMSRRRGEFVTLADLLDAVGRDAARYFFCMYTPSVPMDFDWQLARETSQDNPVYYVQYAHARISSILRETLNHPVGRALVAPAVLAGGQPFDLAAIRDADLSVLTHETEIALLHALAELPEVIEIAGRRREPQRLCTYARELAEAFHVFYTQCRVLSDDRRLTMARLILTAAVRLVLRRTLGLIGVSAPDRM
ncbi:MAG: arginyl-tRNA synthetase, arginyl-tRNA synthetase [Armatimonadetes bacterium CSP1-3]|nr:MAG: arginyl-tRNA synthetase, arginyl-tRNA synthetase [Armatimonadetes bacterium CSP1-3]